MGLCGLRTYKNEEEREEKTVSASRKLQSLNKIKNGEQALKKKNFRERKTNISNPSHPVILILLYDEI